MSLDDIINDNTGETPVNSENNTENTTQNSGKIDKEQHSHSMIDDLDPGEEAQGLIADSCDNSNELLYNEDLNLDNVDDNEVSKKEDGESIMNDHKKVKTAKSPKAKKKLLIGGGVTLAVLLVSLIVFAGLSFGGTLSDEEKQAILENERFEQGITVNKIDVGGKTYSEAIEHVNTELEAQGENVLVELKIQDEVANILQKHVATNVNVEDTLTQALLYTREGSFLKKQSAKKEIEESGKDFPLVFDADEESINTIVETVIADKAIIAKDATIEATAGSSNYEIIPGQSGIQVLPDGIGDAIKTAIETREPQSIEAKYESVDPTYTTEVLKENMVLRGTYSTNVGGTNDRKTNVSLAASKIHGVKVEPGETFDIEDAIGPRTAANGWKQASEIVNGDFVDGYGGGICQASTTLFNAVLRADLEVLQRSNHSQAISYVDIGFDAAISAGGPLFTFKNNTNYPIYIFAYGPSSKLTIDIYGTPLPYGEVTYKESSTVTATIPYTMETTEDPTMEIGTEKIVTQPKNGMKVTSTLVFIDANGNEVKTETWNSTYKAKNGEKLVGTMEVTTAATTAPVVTTAPTVAP